MAKEKPSEQMSEGLFEGYCPCYQTALEPNFSASADILMLPSADTKEEAKEIIRNAGEEAGLVLDDEELDEVSGGRRIRN